MKFALIQERKSPPDKRVVLSPASAKKLQQNFPDLELIVETSPIRVFADEAYREAGFEVTEDVNSADVLLGVKEVPVDALIPNKSYFFFSHTIKKQPYNRKLLQAVLEKNITLYDHETLVNQDNVRLVGFGRYAGIVGAYNGFRAFGQKFELFELTPAHQLDSIAQLVERLKRPFMPPIKIVLSGLGKVGMGAKYILDAMKVKEVNVEDFLTKNYDRPVYVQIDVLDYNKRIDGSAGSKQDFYTNPQLYESNFERFTQVADMYFAGHFYGNGAPAILTNEMLKSPQNKIQVVADISCDVDGPIASTLRASTIANPFYGYHPSTQQEVDHKHPAAISVMAVDNLPCEIPADASEGFGEIFIESIIPSFFNGDQDGILARACIAKNGQLTERFAYLQDYVNG